MSRLFSDQELRLFGDLAVSQLLSPTQREAIVGAIAQIVDLEAELLDEQRRNINLDAEITALRTDLDFTTEALRLERIHYSYAVQEYETYVKRILAVGLGNARPGEET